MSRLGLLVESAVATTLTNDSYEGAEKAVDWAQKLRFERVLWLDGMMS
jgi:hypothetical protein